MRDRCEVPPDPSLSHTVWSWPWTRHIPRRLVLVARSQGLTANTIDDGGWLLRAHLVTVTGPRVGLRRYERTLRRMTRGGPTRNQERARDLLEHFRVQKNEASTDA